MANFLVLSTILKIIILVVFQYLSCVGNETYVRVWEHYEINISVQRKIVYMGSWNLDAGFQQMGAQKWVRRRDLEVRSFKSFLHYISINVLFPNPISL